MAQTVAVDSTPSLCGVVGDRAGRSVANAQCELRPGVPGGGFVQPVPLALVSATARTSTDADGRFQLVAGPGYWSVRIDCPGFARWERDHLVAGEELDVRLDPEVRVVVTVLDPGESPLEGAEVVARPASARTPEEWHCRLRTDARGRAETSALGIGSWRLVVRHPERAAAAVSLNVPVGVGRVDREIRLERGARLVGSVRSEEGEPIAGARVRVESPYKETFLLAEATSDESGRYETAPLFSSRETLEALASAPGYAEATILVGIRPAEVAAGATVQDFVLERSGRRLRGRVVDGAGAAVGEASVRMAAIDLTGTAQDSLAILRVVPEAPWLWQEGARTETTGEFELAGLSSHREYALLILHTGHAPRVVWSPPAEPGSVHDLGDISLVAHGGLFGRALWEDGTPAEGERLAISRTTRVYVTDHKELDRWRPDSWFHVLETVVGADGRFRFDQLAPGTYHLVSESTSPEREEEILPDHLTGPIEVVLVGRAPGAHATITGVVRTSAPEPPPILVQAFVLEDRSERLQGMQMVDAHGAFSVRVPAGLTVRLVFVDLRGAHERYELQLDPARATEHLDVLLEPRAVPPPPIDGLVYGPHGGTLEGSTVTLHPPEDSLCGCVAFHKQTDAAGSFRFSVAEGPHRLIASDSRYASATYAPAWPGDHVVLDLEER